MLSVALVLCCTAVAITSAKDLPYIDIFQVANSGGNTSAGAIISMWSPSFIVTRRSLLINAQCDRAAHDHDSITCSARSHDNGRTWTRAYNNPGGNLIYIKTTDTILSITGPPSKKPTNGTAYGLAAMACSSSCTKWTFDSSTGLLLSDGVGPEALGVDACGKSTMSGVNVKVPQSDPQDCPAKEYKWKLMPAGAANAQHIVHETTGMCLTLPDRGSAIVMPCGGTIPSRGSSQEFVFDNSTGTFQLAPGEFRAGECLGTISCPGKMEERQMVSPGGGLGWHPCPAAMMLHCNTTAQRNPSACAECCKQNWPALANATCTESAVQPFCGDPSQPGPAPLHYPGGGVPDGSERYIIRSTDDGASWSTPMLMNITNTFGPHYAGNLMSHGIELSAPNSRYKGRLAIAARYDSMPNSAMAATYARSFVLYSDDKGTTWTAGELMPEQWTECEVTEMHNGSLLLTSRLGGQYLSVPPGLYRGFARSDDGGATWADWWYLEDRQGDVPVGACHHTLVADTSSNISAGRMFYSHPGAVNRSRSNYTVHRSYDGGASWDLVGVTYQHGAGYSDSNILPDGSLGVVFQRELYNASIEGGGYNLAFQSVLV